jgi:hypothetical protein
MLTPRVRRAIWAVAAGLAALAFVVFIRVSPDTAPDSDFAVTDLRVLNLIRHLDPEGPYSRFGWDHPGPAYFQLLAPLYWLSGYRHLAILVMAIVINVGSIVGVLTIVSRSSRSSLVPLATSVVLGAYVWRAWGLLASAWTAHTTILPLALLIACAAAVAAGRVWCLPAAGAIASFVVQTHIGVAACAGAISIAAVAGLILGRTAARRAGRDVDAIGWPVAISVAIAIVVWALPISDALLPSGGHNAQQLFAFFTQAHAVSTRTTERVFAHYFVSPFGPSLHLPWGLTLPELNEPAIRWIAPLEALLVIVAGAVWLRRGRTFEGALALVVFAGAIGAFFSVRRLPEQPMDHTVYWVSIVGSMCWVVVAACVLDICAAVTRGSATRAAAVGRACVAIASAAAVACGVWQGVERRVIDREISSRIEHLSNVVLAAVTERRVTNPLIVVTQDTWGTVSGVVLQLSRAGLQPAVSADWTDMFGRRLLPTGREPVSIQLVSRTDHAPDSLNGHTSRLVGSVDDFDVYLIDR